MVLSRSVLRDILLPSSALRTEGGELKPVALEEGHVVIEFQCW